jgi:hypothetical protein
LNFTIFPILKHQYIWIISKFKAVVAVVETLAVTMPEDWGIMCMLQHTGESLLSISPIPPMLSTQDTFPGHRGINIFWGIWIFPEIY